MGAVPRQGIMKEGVVWVRNANNHTYQAAESPEIVWRGAEDGETGFVCERGCGVPGLHLEAEDNFDFAVVFAALGDERLDIVVYRAGELRAVWVSKCFC